MNISLSPSAAFFALTLLAGVSTIASDIPHQKIRNFPLAIIAFTALALHIYFKTVPPWMFIENALLAAAISAVLYTRKMWRGGDAKLFFLYSILAPRISHHASIPLPCISIFANAFIMGLLFLVPSLFIGLLKDRKSIIQETFTRETLLNLLNTAIYVLSLSWILFPLLEPLRPYMHSSLSFFVIYIPMYLLQNFLKTNIYKSRFCALIFIAGLILHMTMTPEFFTLTKLPAYLITIALFTLYSHLLYQVTKRFANADSRIPFAPFLFLGCLLSQTSFLHTIMKCLGRS